LYGGRAEVSWLSHARAIPAACRPPRTRSAAPRCILARKNKINAKNAKKREKCGKSCAPDAKSAGKRVDLKKVKSGPRDIFWR
jgi:hypothetical protein